MEVKTIKNNDTKTSRLDGILEVKNVNFAMAENGERIQRERNIILHEPTSVYYDRELYKLEALLTQALMDMSNKYSDNKEVSKTKEEEKKQEDDFDVDNPTDEVIKNQANIYIQAVKTTGGNLADYTDIFRSILGKSEKYFWVEGEKIRFSNVMFDSMSRHNRALLTFCFIVFFVNPLQQLKKDGMIQEEKNTM